MVFEAVKAILDEFGFATTYLVQDYDFNQSNDVVTILECTGGHFSEDVINQLILKKSGFRNIFIPRRRAYHPFAIASSSSQFIFPRTQFAVFL